MCTNRKALLVIVALSLWLNSSDQARSGSQNKLVLFTPEEAVQLRLTEKEWEEEPTITRGLSPGPIIIIQKPQVSETEKGSTIYTVTPTDFLVLFKQNQAPVDMNTLRVWAKKGPFKKSLTDLLKPFIKGTELQAESVEIPEGKFRIGFEIADKEGQETVGEYRLEVKGEE